MSSQTQQQKKKVGTSNNRFKEPATYPDVAVRVVKCSEKFTLVRMTYSYAHLERVNPD